MRKITVNVDRILDKSRRCRDCGGELDFENAFNMCTSVVNDHNAVACKVCRSLHFITEDWRETYPAPVEDGSRAFLEGEEIVHKDAKGVEVRRHRII